MLGFLPSPPKAGLQRARLVAACALAVLALVMAMLLIGRPGDVSVAALRVERIGAFQQDIPACRAALASAGFSTEALADLHEGARCGYSEAVELTRSVFPYSAPVAGSCALAAALALWERDVVAPAAARHLGQAVTQIELAGSPYSCRQVGGRRDRRMSEHARANAIDIGAFTLADGRVLKVASGWRGQVGERAFLRAVRNGACPYFQAVLSPDYNRAHHDHLHFDLGRDKMCR